MDIIGGLFITLLLNILVGGAVMGTLAQAIPSPDNVPREEQSVVREEQEAIAPLGHFIQEAEQNETPSADNR